MAISLVFGGGQVTDRGEFWSRVRNGLQAVRSQRRLTQREVAERLGVPYETYRGWERGTSEVRLDKIEALAEAMGVSPAELLRAIGLGDDPQVAGSAVKRELEQLFGPDEGAFLDRALAAMATLPYNERQLVLRLIGAAIEGRRSAN